MSSKARVEELRQCHEFREILLALQFATLDLSSSVQHDDFKSMLDVTAEALGRMEKAFADYENQSNLH